MKNKAVILGSNYYIGLSAIRCLGSMGIHTVAIDYSDRDRYGAKSKYCSEKPIAPHYKKDKEGFIKFLKEYAKEEILPPVLIPCHDAYVEVVDEYLDELKEWYLIPQTEAGLYTRLMNKETLHKFATEKGVAVPETVRLNEDNFYEKIETIIKYPCIVKPVDSSAFVAKFRTKIFKVSNKEELEKALEKARDANLEVIVQRIIPGFDDHMYTFDAYLNRDSKVTHWMTAQKYRQYPINFGASVYTGQKYVPELYDIGAKFLEDIKYKGFAEIEFKKDAETGQYYLIEINVRLTNFNHLIYKVGLNIPYITYMEMIGEPLRPEAITYDTNRVFWYAYEDILAIKDYLKTGQLSIAEIIKSLSKPKAYAIWSLDDPGPALEFFKMTVRNVFNKIIR